MARAPSSVTHGCIGITAPRLALEVVLAALVLLVAVAHHKEVVVAFVRVALRTANREEDGLCETKNCKNLEPLHHLLNFKIKLIKTLISLILHALLFGFDHSFVFFLRDNLSF